MNKTFIAMVAIFLAIVVVGATAAPLTTVGKSIPTEESKNARWAPLIRPGACEAPVNAFSNKTVSGVVGKKSDGSLICYVPRRACSRAIDPVDLKLKCKGQFIKS